MIPLDEAWRLVQQSLSPLPSIRVPLDEALGLVLAEDMVATEDMPPFAASAMDGYAVIAADSASQRRIIGEQTAGTTGIGQVVPGTAARIMTGAPMPPGADTVIPVEWTQESDDMMRFEGEPREGLYVRPAGQDIAVDDVVLTKGTAIGSPEIGLLATLGRTEIAVFPRPRVAIMATGDELVPPGAPLGPGQIRDSNSHTLAAAVRVAGFEPVSMGIIEDTEAALEAAMCDGLARADMLLTSGGVSMGTRDLIKPILERLGTVHFGRVAVKPGKPLTFASVKSKPVFGLPGFPVSSLVAFENIVRPALRLMSGHSRLWRPRIEARLTHGVRHSGDRTEYQRAVVEKKDDRYWATTTGVQVSGRLKSLVGANALLELPIGIADFAQGDLVTAIMITEPEAS